MRKQMALIGLLALAGPHVTACSDPTGARCTQPDSGVHCTQPSTATRTGNDWRAVIRTNTTERVNYADGGFECSRQRLGCSTRECIFLGAGDNMTSASAITACRDRT